MMSKAELYILFADDDPKVRETLGEILGQVGLRTRCFTGTTACLQHLYRHLCASRTGRVEKKRTKTIRLPDDAKCTGPPLLVLVVTGYEDIATVVNALGVATLAPSAKRPGRRISASDVEHTRSRIAIISPLGGEQLTEMEASILHLILDGKTNSEIAHSLHRSVRTIEAHRRAIMRKLNVDNLVDLVKKSILMGLTRVESTD
jgi:FixJ family two-component response regulator